MIEYQALNPGMPGDDKMQRIPEHIDHLYTSSHQHGRINNHHAADHQRESINNHHEADHATQDSWTKDDNKIYNKIYKDALSKIHLEFKTGVPYCYEYYHQNFCVDDMGRTTKD